MNRHERRRLKRKLAALDAEATATREAFAREHRPGRNLFLTELLSPGQALAHPLFGIGTKEALTAAFGSAHGVGAGLLSECWGCCGRWAPDWPPVAVLTITMRADKGGVGLLCATCAGLQGEETEALILRGIARDFGLQDTRKVTLAPGGHA